MTSDFRISCDLPLVEVLLDGERIFYSLPRGKCTEQLPRIKVAQGLAPETIIKASLAQMCTERIKLRGGEGRKGV